MSGQNTPIKTHSTVSLDTPRVSVEATINSDMTGIKTILKTYFLGAKVGAKIQRTGVGITKVIMQGNPELIRSTLKVLAGVLSVEYGAAIVWGEMSDVAAENRFNSVTIEETLPTLKRDPSSGEFLEKDFEEISFGGSAMTENLKKIAIQAVESVMGGFKGVGVAKGWIPETKEKHISVKLGEKRIDLEISSITSMESLLNVIGTNFEIAVPIKTVYRLEDNDIIKVTDVKNLREGFLYYALTVNEELPKKQTVKFTNMDEFFEKLTNDQDMSDAQVKIAREKLGEQGITFKQLMAIGELAITDQDLAAGGITQLGLRKAILAVIKSNQ